MKRKRRSKRTHNRHHIFPRSRHPRPIGGNNIAWIPITNHSIYHQLFSNMTPPEIIAHLVNFYWNQQWHYVEEALNKIDSSSKRVPKWDALQDD